MLIVVMALATLACQSPPAPTAPAPIIRLPSGIDWSKEPAPAPASPATSPSVADLFKARAAREAEAKAAEDRSAPVAPGQYHCRRTETGSVCGNDEAAMKRSEAAAKAALDRALKGADAPQ